MTGCLNIHRRGAQCINNLVRRGDRTDCVENLMRGDGKQTGCLKYLDRKDKGQGVLDISGEGDRVSWITQERGTGCLKDLPRGDRDGTRCFNKLVYNRVSLLNLISK